ncbi:MAG: gamma-glutamyltransferase family protein [Nitrospirae bacterium]|nr:gamma-glutamyltransferase family protein [Nitrospirota bacterium]
MAAESRKDILSTLVGPRAGDFTTRPVVMGTHGMVTSGHYLASGIGLHILERGGNAVDAAAGMGFALSVLEPHLYGIAGEAPLLIFLADSRRVMSVSGQGPAPQRATIEWFRREKLAAIPGDGLLAATVPDAVSTWITALMHFGTMRLSDVMEPSLELAERGFPMYGVLHFAIQRNAQRFQEEWPTSAETYLPDGRVPAYGELFVQNALAGVFRRLMEAEHREARRGRREGLQAAHDLFYRGEIAERIVTFAQGSSFPDASGDRHGGLLSKEDLSRYAARIEEPVTATYRGYDVYKCGPWTQGPVFLEQLNLLEGFDLASLGHNSPQYIHLVTEAAKLAFADREQYYGDPDFVAVPLDVLLSKEYAAERRKLIDHERASMELRPGNVPPHRPEAKKGNPKVYTGDTTHLDAVDRWGNMVAATPSGGWFASSPVIPGLGFPLGTRLQIFHLDPAHPNALHPGKRPRTTLTPSVVLKDGNPFMVFGTPGGDQQDQWTLQFFLNCVDFGMNMQAAADAPIFHSAHFPSSFYPHGAHPGSLVIEARVGESTISSLRGMGHQVQVAGEWSNGRVLGIRFNMESGVISGVASPRMETGYAMGW